MRKGYLSRIIWTIATLGTFSEQSSVVSNAGNNENTTKVSVLSTSVLLGATSAKMQTSTVSNMTNEWSKTTSGLEANSAFSTATKNRKTANATSTTKALNSKNTIEKLPTTMTRRTSNSAASNQGIVPTSTQTKEDTFAKKGVKEENKRNIIYVGIIIALTMLVAILLMVITYYFYRNRALKLSNARVENVCTGIEEPVDLLPDEDGEVIENKGEEGDTTTNQDEEITTNQDEEITPKQDEEIATVMPDGEITPNQDEEIAATKFDEEITTNQDEEINKIQIEAIVTSAEITTEHGDEMVNQQDEKEAYNHDNTMTVKETEF